MSGAASKDTRRIGLDLGKSSLDWKPGDALGIWPCNAVEVVKTTLAALGLPADTPVTLKGAGTVGLHDALLRHFDLARPNPAMLHALGRSEGGYLPELLQAARLMLQHRMCPPCSAGCSPGFIPQPLPRSCRGGWWN